MNKKNRKKAKSAVPKYNELQNSCFMCKLAWTSGEKKVILLSLASATFAVALNLLNLYVSPVILSALERHTSLWELAGTILGFTLALMFVSVAGTYVDNNTMYGRISVRTMLINLLNRKACTTSYPNVQDEKFIRLQEDAESATESNSASAEAIWTTLTSLLTNVVGFAIYIFLLSAVQPFLIAVILVTTLVSYFITNYLNGYRYRHREEQEIPLQHMSYVNGIVRSKDIRIFGMRPWIREVYNKAMDSYTAFHRKAQNVYIWGSIVDLVLTFLRNGAAYAYLIGLVLGGSLDVAGFLLYFGVVGGFTAWVTGILGDCSTLHRQSLEISMIREYLEYEEPFRFAKGEALSAQGSGMYELVLEDVSFHYPGAQENTLSHINLTLHPGEKLAVVGLNGAGKTTLIKLMCGFYDPTEGRVLLNGKDIREYNRADYYKMFSAVFQDFTILPATIAANVAQTEDHIDMDRVRSSVEKAGLREKVKSLPEQYQTKLNRQVYEDATLLSGGETQRLMLARALYKDAPFIVLDEPTAALDPIAESDLYRKYHEMTSAKSSVYISHRLASTRFCDRIILMDGGGICEEGTHMELLARKGKYAELYEVQSKYYREGGDGNAQEGKSEGE